MRYIIKITVFVSANFVCGANYLEDKYLRWRLDSDVFKLTTWF